MEIKIARDIRSCNACDATNYKPSVPYHGKIVERLYELRIGYTVLCLCESCLKEVCLVSCKAVNGAPVNEKIRNKLPIGALIFDDASYDNAIIGISLDNRVIYSFEKMVQEHMKDNSCDESEAAEWIEYNAIRSLPYAGEKAPIIAYKEIKS